jgi:hypothetical protein
MSRPDPSRSGSSPRPAPRAPALLRLLLLALFALVSAGAPAAAAEPRAPDEAPVAGPAEETGPPAVPPEPAAAAADLVPRRIPSGAGWVLILLALPPLFWGWKIIRMTMAVFFGFVGALAAYEGVAPRAGMGWGGAAAGGGVVLGAFLGWHIRKPFAALEGGAVVGLVFALPGFLLEHELLTFGPGLVGFALGLVLGWKAAFYLDALDSALAGGFLAGLGARVVTQDRGDDVSLLVGIVVIFLATLAGIAVQFRSVARRAGKTTG